MWKIHWLRRSHIEIYLYEFIRENWVVEIWSNVLHLLHVNHLITWNSRQMRTFYPAFYLLVRIHYIHINTHAHVVHIPFFMLNHLIIYVYISDHSFRAHIFYETIRIMRKYYVPKWNILSDFVHTAIICMYMIRFTLLFKSFDLALLMIYLIIVSCWYENLCRKYVVRKRSGRLAVKSSYNDFLFYKMPTA